MQVLGLWTPKTLSVGAVLSARRWPLLLELQDLESLVPLGFPASLAWPIPATVGHSHTHGRTYPVASSTQAAQPQSLSACPASVIKTGSPEHRAESPTSHWRGWEASPLRRRRKETWVCFLGSENKPEWRERVNTRLSKAFKTKPVKCNLDRHRELCADF